MKLYIKCRAACSTESKLISAIQCKLVHPNRHERKLTCSDCVHVRNGGVTGICRKMQAIKESVQGSQKRARTAAAKPLPHKALKPEVADKLGNAADDIDIEDIAFFTAQEAIQAKLCTSLLLAASLLNSRACLVLPTTIWSVYWYKDPEGFTHSFLLLPDSAGAACLV